MKTSIYLPCLILIASLLLPVTACATKAAAEKQQEPPSRQEHTAPDTTASRIPSQPAAANATSHTGATGVPQSAAPEAQSPKPAAKPDAVSGATMDTVSGASVPQRHKKAPASESETKKGEKAKAPHSKLKPAAPSAPLAAAAPQHRSTDTARSSAAASQKHTPAASADKTTVNKATADKAADKVTAAQKTSMANQKATAVPNNTPKAIAAEKQAYSTPSSTADKIGADKTAAPKTVVVTEKRAKPAAATAALSSKPEESVLEQNASGNSGKATSQQPIASSPTPTGKAAPAATADKQAQSTTTVNTPDTSAPPPAEQPEPVYETTLAELISDFEKQGGSHGYVPPPTFNEEMRDLFSPHLFTVALSKEPETEQKPKISRMVAIEEKQRLELTYPGHGWVYVGEQTSQPGLKYEQRKLQDNESIFMFTAEKKGDYILQFSYFDVFTNEFVTDAVAVSVSAARSTAAKSMVKAPEYQNEADSAASASQTEKNTKKTAAEPSRSATTGTVSSAATRTTQTASEVPQAAPTPSQSARSEEALADGAAETASATIGSAGDSTGQASAGASAEAPLSAEQLLEKARTAIAAADASAALTYLDTFFITTEDKLDEGLFLKGRAYELNGSVRNIRLALDAYRTLTDTYPQSKYWAEADARIRYITSFYINIQ